METPQQTYRQAHQQHELTASEAYRKAERLWKRYQSGAQVGGSTASTQAADVTLLPTIIETLKVAKQLFLQTDLLSKNESIEDIATKALPYLLIDARVGEILQDWPGIDDRYERVVLARHHWKVFLNQCDHLNILDEMEERLWIPLKNQLNHQESDDTTTTSLSPFPYKSDPAMLRAQKITKFKRERELKSQLEELGHQLKERRQKFRKGTSSDSAQPAAHPDEDDEDDHEFSDEEDESLRKLYLARIHLSILASVDSLTFSSQELVFLKQRREQQFSNSTASSPSASQAQSTSSTNQPSHQPLVYHISSKSDLNNPIPAQMQQYLHRVEHNSTTTSNESRQNHHSTATSTTQPIVQPFSSNIDSQINRSAHIRETIFRQPNPATISVEDWAEEEMRAGRLPGPSKPVVTHIESRNYIRSRNDAGADGNDEEEDVTGELGGETGERNYDEKRREAIEWDNWKDENEKGSGNRNRR